MAAIARVDFQYMQIIAHSVLEEIETDESIICLQTGPEYLYIMTALKKTFQ